ncbi:MAG: hypothetical protein HQK49_19015 [Oligoflexia bacterium]|nr:hypothetical protein [Oligoflexia bacterium]
MDKLILSFTLFTLFIMFSFSSAEVIAGETRDIELKTLTEKELKELIYQNEIAKTLPSEVFIKTPFLTTNGLYDFALKDDRIWIKKRTNPLREMPYYDVFGATLKVDTEWRLLGKNGMPFFTGINKNDPLPNKIISISVDADHLIAIGDNGKVYQYGYKKGYRSGKPDNPKEYTLWSYRWGAPIETPLSMPEKYRAYAIGRHNSETMFYTDQAGNEINYGERGISHLYILSDNGQEINIADTGLPADFSRQYTGPDRGRFIAENISVAGEHIFLISKYGEMYTKFEDYDSNGGTPFFNYYYGANKMSKLKGDDFDTQLMPRKLPLADWKKQPTIPTGEKGKISKNITIIVKGQGDQNREIRVQGLNSEGKPGYYYKMVTSDKWQFQETNNEMKIDEKDFIENDPQKLARGQNNDIKMFGEMEFKTGLLGSPLKPNLQIELLDYNMYATPITMRVHINEKKHFDLLVHTVDSYFMLIEKDPEHYSNNIRRMKGTLEIPKDVLKSTDKEISELVNNYFKPFHLQTFKLPFIGNKQFAEMWSKTKYNGEQVSIKMSFAKDSISSKIDPKTITHYTEIANNQKLLLNSNNEKKRNEGKEEKNESQFKLLLDKVGENLKALKEIKEDRKDIKSKVMSESCLRPILKTAFGIEQFASFILQYDHYWSTSKYARNITDQSLYPIFETSKAVHNILWKNGAENFRFAKNILISRICSYLSLAKEQFQTQQIQQQQQQQPKSWKKFLEVTFQNNKELSSYFKYLKNCKDNNGNI